MGSENCSQAAPGEPLRLLYVSRSRGGGHADSTLRAHPFTELFYVLSGRGRFQAGGEVLALGRDDLVVVSPGTAHTELTQVSAPLEYIAAGFSGRLLQQGGAPDTGCIRLSCAAQREEYLFYLGQMLQEMQHRPEGYEDVCRSLAEIFAAKLLRRAAHMPTGNELPKFRRECGIARRYMDQNFREVITLDLLASLTHMNKYYLVHAFSREMGCSPISYLIARRISESKALLEDTDLSVSQISRELGFSSPSYFSQSFRKAAGCGPSEYRRTALAKRTGGAPPG